jgi:hypothetical protein
MLNMYPRHQLQARNADDGVDEGIVDEVDGGYNPFYGIAVVCLSIFLFFVLAASVTVWKALAVAALAALLLGVGGCFAPKGWLRRPATGQGASASAGAELVVTARLRVRSSSGRAAGVRVPVQPAKGRRRQV